MRRGLIAVLLAAAALVPASAAHASCVLAVTYHGATYYGTSIPVAAGAPLSGGVIPGCNDTVTINAETGEAMTPDEPDTPVDLHRIPGLPARLGVEYNGRAQLAAGYLPELASHPLHARFRTARPASCGKPYRTKGRVLDEPLPGSPVYLQDGRLLTLTSGTKVRGLLRGGYPYLGAGEKIAAVVRRCDGVTVATAITRP